MITVREFDQIRDTGCWIEIYDMSKNVLLYDERITWEHGGEMPVDLKDKEILFLGARVSFNNSIVFQLMVEGE